MTDIDKKIEQIFTYLNRYKSIAINLNRVDDRFRYPLLKIESEANNRYRFYFPYFANPNEIINYLFKPFLNHLDFKEHLIVNFSGEENISSLINSFIISDNKPTTDLNSLSYLEIY